MTRRSARRCWRRSTGPASSTRSSPRSRCRRPARSRRARRCSTRRPIRRSRSRPPTRRRPSRPPAGTRRTTAGTSPGAKKPLALEVLSPEQSANPGAYAVAEAVTADWKTLGLAVTHIGLPPATFVNDRLAAGAVRGGGHRRDGRPRPRPVPVARVEPDPDRWLEHRRRPGHGPRQGTRRGPQTRHGRASARRRIRRSRSVSARADTCSRWPSPTRPSWSATTSSDRPSDRSPTRLIDFGMC